MKKIILTVGLLLAGVTLYAQSPQKMTYQSVIRNTSDALISSSSVGIQISILQGSVSGTAVYIERHTPTTNINGLATLEIGAGTVVAGSFGTIDWSNGPYFIKTETDPNGGTTYSISGTSQLLSVPYALYAETSGDGFSGDYNDLTNAPTTVSSFTNDAGYVTTSNDADADPTNEIQIISINGSDLSISNGNTVTLPAGSAPQTLSSSGSNITLSDGGGTVSINDSDADPTNELQTLTLSGSDLSISGGNTITLPSSAGGNTLDQAYDQGGAGLGRTITADAGAVEINTATPSGIGLDVNHSNTGVAIRARSTNISNSFATAQFETNSSQGTSLAPVAAGVGVYTGSSAYGAGLAGQNLLTTAGIDAHGVYGLASNNASGGIYGRNAIGFGTVGTGLYGVLGEAENINGGGVVGQIQGGTQAGYLGAYRNSLEYAVYADNDILFEGFLDGASGGTYRISGDATTGNFSIIGMMSKGGGTFKIDHPLDPENKYLYHSFVESPEMLNIYNGVTQFDANGFAKVELPEYFEALNKDFTYQLTAIGGAMPDLYVAEEVDQNNFTIGGGVPGKKVSWQVTGVRKDNFANDNRVVTEVEKESYNKGRYMHPSAFGLPDSQGIYMRDPNGTTEMQEGHINRLGKGSTETINLNK